jgi:hypothetical protein
VEDVEDDRQGDRGLGRCEDDHEDREHPALHPSVAEAVEGDEVDVGRVQDHLDAHEDIEDVPTADDADDAECEEHSGHRHVGLDAHQATSSGSKSSVRRRAM